MLSRQLAQWRQTDRHHVQQIVQPAIEAAGFHRRFHVAGGGSNQSHVQGGGLEVRAAAEVAPLMLAAAGNWAISPTRKAADRRWLAAADRRGVAARGRSD